MLRDAKDFKKAMIEAKHELEIEVGRPAMPPIRTEPAAAAAPGTRLAGVPARPPPAPRPRSAPHRPRPSSDEIAAALGRLGDLRDRGADHARGVRGQEGGAARPALAWPGAGSPGTIRRRSQPNPRSSCSSTTRCSRSSLVAIFLLVAFPVHEFAHAWAAYLQGDATAKLFGRLTLNPIVHFDPIGGMLHGASRCCSARSCSAGRSRRRSTRRTSATGATAT